MFGLGSRIFVSRKDVFDLKLKDVGKVNKLTVTHDGSGFASAWFLEKVGRTVLLFFTFALASVIARF